jgi:purine-binding chemotaxis protein CheW
MSIDQTSEQATAKQYSPSAVSANAATSIREFLAFKLGSEEYGIDILRVQEIRSYEPPTRMANAPEFIKGVINLRGVIVPIIDMRLKFNLEQVNYDAFTVVIVLNIGSQVIGMVVDGVSDVITLTPEQLRPVPAFSSAVGSDHLLAIGSVQDRMLILLDIEKLMSSTEMGLISEVAQ